MKGGRETQCDVLLLCCRTKAPEMFVCSGEILFMPTNTCVDVFGGAQGWFPLERRRCRSAEDPTVFQRLLETSEGNIWKRAC